MTFYAQATPCVFFAKYVAPKYHKELSEHEMSYIEMFLKLNVRF